MKRIYFALAATLVVAILLGNIVQNDERGVFAISRDYLSDYGSFAPSSDGKKLLDEPMETLIPAVPNHEVIAKYLSGKKNGISASARKDLKGTVTTGAYEAAPVVKRYDYMTISEKAVGPQIAAFAARYAGTYSKQTYTNENLGIRWTVPETWYIYNDTNLRNYNGGTADKFLLAGKPVYIFAAKDEENMVDIRLYPFDVGSDYDARAKDCAGSLFDSYEAVCKGNYSEVETSFEKASFGGDKTWSGTFTFKADGRTFCRRQYYIVREDAVAVVSVTTEESVRDLTSLGF